MSPNSTYSVDEGIVAMGAGCHQSLYSQLIKCLDVIFGELFKHASLAHEELDAATAYLVCSQDTKINTARFQNLGNKS